MVNIYPFFKRFLDIVSSSLGLLILSPLLLIISLVIKFTSKGPILFKQDRLGKNGKVYKIYKFRTMVDNAEQIGSGIRTSLDDPRITRFGSFLRRTSLDELPQLINVLEGTMSVVGPRPPVPYHPMKIEDYNEQQKIRFKVKPGITGLAQVTGRNTLTWDERFNFDTKYVKGMSLLLDIKIILKTFAVFANKNSIYNLKSEKENKNADVNSY